MGSQGLPLTSSAAAEFGFGKSSTALNSLPKVYQWRSAVQDLPVCNVNFIVKNGLTLNKKCIMELHCH